MSTLFLTAEFAVRRQSQVARHSVDKHSESKSGENSRLRLDVDLIEHSQAELSLIDACHHDRNLYDHILSYFEIVK